MRQNTAMPAVGGVERDASRLPLPRPASSAFHPHRLHPRYSGLFSTASRLPGGLRAASRVLGGVAFDRASSATENATDADLRSAYLAVCGFPRTGTTFLQRAITTALGDETVCFKNHDPLTVPRYDALGLTTLITLRDPLDTVVSWSLYHADNATPERLSARLATYIAWHREIRRRVDSPWVTVIDFDNFCAAPGELLNVVLGGLVTAHVTPQSVSDVVRTSNDTTRLPIKHGNVPDARRDELKQPYLVAARDPRVDRMLVRAGREYERLRARTLRLPA